MTTFFAVLDPQITYNGLKTNFANDLTLFDNLQKSKQALHESYNMYYALRMQPLEGTSTATASQASSSFGQIDFTACYDLMETEVIDKLDAFYEVKHQKFKSCNPL